jgi:hypothetical protein
VAGVLHWYFPETQYIRHIIISGRFYGKDSVLTIREDSAIMAAAMGDSGRWVSGFHVLYYRRTPGRRDVLEGHWESMRPVHREKTGCARHPAGEEGAPVYSYRHTPKEKRFRSIKGFTGPADAGIATIPVRGTDTVKVVLYDNGEIDGDSVSLYMNNELLLQHYKLTAQPKVLLVAHRQEPSRQQAGAVCREPGYAAAEYGADGGDGAWKDI